MLMKKYILSSLMVLLTSAMAWADAETIDFTLQSFTNAQRVDDVTGTNCTVTFALGGNAYQTYPRYYDNGTAIRIYAGNTMTVTAENNKTISAITLVFSSGGNSNDISVSTGTFAVDTWTGNATEVTFTVGGTKGHRRVKQVQVTYTSAVAAPVISGSTSFEVSTTVTITAEEGATIRYTKDGSDPTSSSGFTLYGSPFELTTTATVKAVAIKGDVMSNVTTMLFVKDVGLWTGSGTKADPFVIDTPEKLNQLATRVNAGDQFPNTYFKMTADIDYAPKSVWNDVSSEENNFESIGINGKDFRGIFDGQNHTISGIRFCNPNKYMVGLFGKLASSAVVKNVVLANSRIISNDRSGGIVGHNESGTIENCHVLADVMIHDKASSNLHGGVVGKNESVIRGCTSAATLSIDDGEMANSYGGNIRFILTC